MPDGRTGAEMQQQQAPPPPSLSSQAPIDSITLTEEAAERLMSEEEERRKLRRSKKGRIRELEEVRMVIIGHILCACSVMWIWHLWYVRHLGSPCVSVCPLCQVSVCRSAPSAVLHTSV